MELYWDIEITPEDEEKMIGKIARKIHDYNLNLVAILMIQGIKPLSFLGAQMGRFFFSPFLPFFGEDIGIGGEKFFQIFEDSENVEKLIKAVEKLTRKEEEQKKAKQAETGGASKKKGWRRFIPF